MTQLLESGMVKIANLPEEKQDSLASFIRSELESETKWDALFASSPDASAKLAQDAVAEFEQGETKPLDLERDFPNN